MSVVRAWSVYTEAPTGGDRVYLDLLGYVSGITFDFMYPGGPSSFTCSFQCAPNFYHRGLVAGRRLFVPTAGGVLWAGRMDAPQRGAPWKITAVGIGSLSKSYVAVNGSGNASALALDTVVDAAIARGLPWTRPATLGTVTTGTNVVPSGSIMLDAALTQGCTALTKAWRVTAAGVVTSETPPTVPTLLFMTAVPLYPTLIDGFHSTDVAYYVASVDANNNSVTGVAVVTNTSAETHWGHSEAIFDLTSQGVISTASTQATADLAQTATILRVTDPMPVSRGQILSMGGAVVDLATVIAGTVIRIQQVVVGRETLTSASGPLDVLIGHTSYDCDTDTLTITPVGESRNDLTALLAASAA